MKRLKNLLILSIAGALAIIFISWAIAGVVIPPVLLIKYLITMAG